MERDIFCPKGRRLEGRDFIFIFVNRRIKNVINNVEFSFGHVLRLLDNLRTTATTPWLRSLA